MDKNKKPNYCHKCKYFTYRQPSWGDTYPQRYCIRLGITLFNSGETTCEEYSNNKIVKNKDNGK